jgi:hypothetical protein
MRTLSVAACFSMAVFAAACSEPLAPNPAEEVRFNFLNGPTELPNVFRFETRFPVVVADLTRGLVVVTNFPEDPRTRPPCGGTNPADFAPIQEAGQITEVIKMLSNDQDASLHVYNLADIPGAGGFFPNNAAFCTAMWIARGQGRMVYTDNDWTGSGPGSNTWRVQMTGQVVMEDGGASAQLNASQHFMIRREEFRAWPGRVMLH